MVTPTSEAKNNPMAAKITQDYLAGSSVFAQIFFLNDILSTTTNYERKSPSNMLELRSENNLAASLGRIFHVHLTLRKTVGFNVSTSSACVNQNARDQFLRSNDLRESRMGL